MPSGWANSNRRAELPSNWRREIRPAVLERDGYQCRAVDNDQRCTEAATDVDHIGDRHDHSLTNLQALCRWHHDRKTSADRNAMQRRPSTTRPREPHPGLLPPADG